MNVWPNYTGKKKAFPSFFLFDFLVHLLLPLIIVVERLFIAAKSNMERLRRFFMTEKESTKDYQTISTVRKAPFTYGLVMTSWLVIRYHSLAAAVGSLSDDVEVTSRTHNGIIMGLRHRKYTVEGVQVQKERKKEERKEKGAKQVWLVPSWVDSYCSWPEDAGELLSLTIWSMGHRKIRINCYTHVIESSRVVKIPSYRKYRFSRSWGGYRNGEILKFGYVQYCTRNTLFFHSPCSIAPTLTIVDCLPS